MSDCSDRSIKDHCGLFGIVGDPDAPYLTCQGIHALQHRGQEGAGIVCGYADGYLSGTRGLGLVTEHFNESRLARLKGDRAIGHVRYSTVRRQPPAECPTPDGGMFAGTSGNRS